MITSNMVETCVLNPCEVVVDCGTVVYKKIKSCD